MLRSIVALTSENDLSRYPQISRKVELIRTYRPETCPVRTFRRGVVKQACRTIGRSIIRTSKEHRIERIKSFSAQRQAHPFSHSEALLQRQVEIGNRVVAHGGRVARSRVVGV